MTAPFAAFWPMLDADQPWWLLLAVLTLPATVVALRWFSSMSHARRWVSIAVRSALVLLLASVLAGVASVRTSAKLAVIAVVDVSGSVRSLPTLTDDSGTRMATLDAAREFLRAASAHQGPEDLLGLVVFDGRAAALATPAPGFPDRELDIRLAEGTDIAGAIRLARSLIPPDASGRLLLISDGVQTRGDALAAATEAFGAGGRAVIQIDTVPIDYRIENDVEVVSLDAPPRAISGSTINLRAVLRATGPARGMLRLLREGIPVDMGAAGTGLRIELVQGTNVFVLPIELPDGRVHRFEAIFEADTPPGPSTDTITENNRAGAFTITPGRGSVLIIDGAGDGREDGPNAILARTLRDAGIDVRLVPPEAAPIDPLSLESYDLVVLQSVPSERLDSAAQSLLASAVRDLGLGLVMIGGHDSFGAGGWKGTPIEPLLPVLLDLPETLIVPEVAIVFVLDNSGSMRRTVMGSARSQQEIANESAAAAVRMLDPADMLGVVVFNSRATVLRPLGKLDDPNQTADQIRRISPDGGTNLGPGLDLAAGQFEGVQAKVKHIIVLSDGKSMNADNLPDKARALRARGITVSTISIGDDADVPTMNAIAAQGGGTSYEVLNPNVLPRVFLKAVRIVRNPMVREEPFLPRIADPASPLTSGLPTLPPLRGLNLTRIREEPTITLALDSPGGEPVLAHWNVELGQVAAFTSDASLWAGDWIDSPVYARFWTQLARSISRPLRAGGYDAAATVEGDELRLRLSASSPTGVPINALTVPGTIYAPGGETRAVHLVQIGPGEYEAVSRIDTPGSHVAILKPFGIGSAALPLVTGATVPGGEEYRRFQSDRRLMERIAAVTGGRVLEISDPDAAAIFDRSGVRPRRAMTALTPILLAWSIAVLLLDIATRRIAWDRWVSREFGVGLARAATESVRDRTDQVREAITGLASRRPIAPEPVDAPLALSDEDARLLAIAAADRRRQSRLAAIRAAHRPETSSTTTPELSIAPPPSGDLKEAKRRARERFEESQ